jgi:protein SFI1
MPLHLRSTGPGYLKTPSKRTLIQHKRAELMGSPEKRVARLGAAASAPPASRMRDVGGEGGFTSFQRRLREGGFGGDEGGRDKGRGRVGFGDVSHFG